MSPKDLVGFVNISWVVWMVLVFLSISIWTYLPRNKARLESYKNIPFQEDETARGNGQGD